MVATTTLAAGDILTGIVSFWDSFRVPGAICLIIAGVCGAIFGLHKGFAHAAGKLIGGIALAVIALGAVGLAVSGQETVNKHTGGVLVGQYGQ